MSGWKRVQLDPEHLIKAVKKRSILYNKENPHYYNNKMHKNLSWTEVCKEIIPKWEKMTPQEKVECCHEIQKRWKSLRTCFGREVAEQKKEEKMRKKNLYVKRRKTYGYFNQMSFLLPSYNSGCRSSKVSDQEDSDNAESNDAEDDDDPLDSTIKSEIVFERESSRNNEECIVLDANNASKMMLDTDNAPVSNIVDYHHIYESNQSTDGKIIEYFKDAKKDEEDDDKQFLMSLIPTFRKLNDKQKFEARIEILKVLKDISFKTEAGCSS